MAATQEKWPQPYEGIYGTDRTGDWLLSLDSRAAPHRDALVVIARHLLLATSVAQPAPNTLTVYQRITAPKPGDLVVEQSAALHTTRRPQREHGLGIFLCRRTEWAETDTGWEESCAQVAAAWPDSAAALTGERYTDVATYIQYGPDPADICRWVDASVIALPVRGSPGADGAPAERRPGQPVEAAAPADEYGEPARMALTDVEAWAARMRAAGAGGGEPAFATVRSSSGTTAGPLAKISAYPADREE